jgi:hypothetical protein
MVTRAVTRAPGELRTSSPPLRKGPRGFHHNRSGAEGPPSQDVGLRRLPVDGRDVPAAARSAARRGVRDRARPARARRRVGHRQRGDPGRAARRRGRRQRPHARAVRGGPRPCRGGRRRAPVGRGRRRAAAVRGRLVRRRHVVDRRHVRAASRGRGRRARPRPAPGRDARAAQLGARRHARCAVRDHEHPHDYAQHFKDRYGPTIAARANAAREGREAEFDAALDRFCDEWNRGTADRARFEMEYLLTVATRK